MANMNTHIHLSTDAGFVLALIIPLNDIRRLSLRPLKWLRYVTFAVCGVHGDLRGSPNGAPVDYEAISHQDPLTNNYYYIPHGETDESLGEYRFIDHNALNDRMTSSVQTTRRRNFRQDVMDRDGARCVFTKEPEHLCDAAHILPKRKGDEYIRQVIRDRCHLYNPPPELNDIGINSVVNGLFLTKNLHAQFAHGDIAFIKTPTFALNPEDIPLVETPLITPTRITLQHLASPTGNYPIPPCDAIFTGTGNPLPESILLDYIYGAAAYRRWGGGQDIAKLMQDRYEDMWQDVPPPSYCPSSGSDELNDFEDPNHQPRRRSGRHHRREAMSNEMLKAMDNISALSMLIKGYTPQSIALEQRRHEKEEMARAKEASQAKVQEWMGGLFSLSSSRC